MEKAFHRTRAPFEKAWRLALTVCEFPAPDQLKHPTGFTLALEPSAPFKGMHQLDEVT